MGKVITCDEQVLPMPTGWINKYSNMSLKKLVNSVYDYIKFNHWLLIDNSYMNIKL